MLEGTALDHYTFILYRTHFIKGLKKSGFSRKELILVCKPRPENGVNIWTAFATPTGLSAAIATFPEPLVEG